MPFFALANKIEVKKIFIKKKKEAAILRNHPWVFSGAVERMESLPEDGEQVELYSVDNKYLATGHYQDGSICVRIFSFEKTEADQDFWNKKIKNAFAYRHQLGLVNNLSTTCFRLVHAEGDGLPGLIIDIYDKVAVIQCHSIGMHLSKQKICTAVRNAFDNQLEAVFDKSKESLPKQYAASVTNSYLYGKSNGYAIVHENDHLFKVNWEEGQKTGFFLDQRINRHMLGRYSKGQAILNTFAYSGGFSIYALNNEARLVDSVDISQTAVSLIDENVVINELADKEQSSIKADVLSFLKNIEFGAYDIIILDPPAFAKSVKKRHNAIQGYKRLNKLALDKIKPGGLLFTFSCSQVVDKALFDNTIVAAALESNRKVRIMHHLSQPPDHPVNLFHPEGSYLKGLVLQVE